MAAGAAPRPMTVLVLGVGGNVSQGILKALAIADLPTRVVAGCISPLSLGLYRADLALVTPLADDASFLPWLEATCAAEGVDAVLSGSEPVLEALAPVATAVHERTGAVCVVSTSDVLEIGQDKLQTARWLERQGLAFPRSAPADDPPAVDALAAAAGLPLVAKPRRGKGADRVTVVRTSEELGRQVGQPGILLQEHLPDDDGEYTVGCMVDGDGRVQGSVAMRRQLAAGTTACAQIGAFPQVRAYAEAIAEALAPRGPVNVQLRVRDGRPVAFELNVRYSGTTPLRARAGFNEVEAALRHFVLGQPMTLPDVTEGTVVRYWNELYVPASAHAALAEHGRLEDPWGEAVVVEDWGIGR